ncbi:MAG TPA: nucleotidyl transferase AbiEii/AbiGii toxin family protein [Phycisphaerae bacterium]|nr:nucleotidyl transferase AbiEii/AbiGii toxin family protein [Phycisphaerae bacterium]
MAKSFGTPAAFKQALEARLKKAADARGVPVNSLRLKFVIERLLARLFAKPSPPWLLKGGYALELRYRPKARTTTDIDLTVKEAGDAALMQRLDAIRDELQDAADADLGDFLEFRIGASCGELPGPPEGGSRFPVEALLAGRNYGRFHIDVGFGDAVIGDPEILAGDDFLSFVGIAPAKAIAIPRAQQFAEKLHAYTYPWTDRPNTRTKDLVDMLLLIEKGLAPDDELRRAIHATFDTRKRQAVPHDLVVPPDSWQEDFAAMAREVDLSTSDITLGFNNLTDFWRKVRNKNR